MKLVYALLLVCCSLPVAAQELAIIPQPVSVKKLIGGFKINPSTFIVASSFVKKDADLLNDYLKKLYGFSLSIKNIDPYSAKAKNCITIGNIKPADRKENYYRITVNKDKIEIAGVEAGVFYGIQTFLQLLPPNKFSFPYTINAVAIEDYPRFKYRGLHLDVVRHFFPVEYVKKYIDYIAFHKMNYFHWHLTDDQGWRIEIKKYPKLTSVGAYRNGTIIGRYPGTGNDGIYYGGYYTQEEIKDVVKYAADRYITVIPEIEMPGHASAAIAAYPQLSCFPEESTKHPAKCAWNGDSTGKHVQQTWGIFEDVFCPSEYTFNFLQDVLDEVMALFPSPYIHIGGDECPKTSWKRSSFCQELMREKGLKDEHELQSYFVQRIEKYINSKGRSIIGWDEILEGGLAPNATVMSWRGEKGGIAAASQDHQVIMTPSSHLYLDHKQTNKEDSVTIGGYTPVEKTYNYNPIAVGVPLGKEKYILGAQANLWTEYIKNTKKVEYMLFPRLSALSEALWSPLKQRNYKSFEKRLKTQVKRYKLWGANHNPTFY